MKINKNQSDVVLKTVNDREVPMSEQRLVKWTQAIYLLHGFSVLVGVTSAGVAIMTAFIFGWTSIVAVIINYVLRDDVRNTWLDSHFAWQINTFWWVCGCATVGAILFMTFFLIPLAFLIWGVGGIWVTYRLVKGWIYLMKHQSIS